MGSVTLQLQSLSCRVSGLTLGAQPGYSLLVTYTFGIVYIVMLFQMYRCHLQSCLLQAGAWDVDDTGLEYMPNKDVAERIQKKVLNMYIRDTVIATALLAAFCFWPL